MSENKLYRYLSDGIGFESSKATGLRTIYAPLCGVDAAGLKSSITPFLSGDIKIDKNRYLTKPVSTEDLREDVRNFFVYAEGRGVVSMTDKRTEDSAHVQVGQLWHKLVCTHPEAGLELTALNFVPVTGEPVELMRLRMTNISSEAIKVTPTVCVPLFGRALSNKHDHEHVTSLLHRITQCPNGVLVQPTMIFNEEGHQPNEMVYFVLGADAQGGNPVGTFPTAENFYGDGARRDLPQAVIQNNRPHILADGQLQGKEAVGALRFQTEDLPPGASREFLVMMGIGASRGQAQEIFDNFNSTEKFDQALARNKEYWFAKTHTIKFSTGDQGFDSWMHWVTLQPVLRRIFGCSFLPDHDYGKGGKGWRDIWQDLLSLILIEPGNIREPLVHNFAGVRIDGSNATIIGSVPGEFIADRNAITRVWMDHGLWPLTTLALYIHQTGDYDILLEENTYFRDVQMSRATEKDYQWSAGYGNKLKDKRGDIYYGSLIEHILVQHLVQFFNVGEHNITRLESADWNDGLDMAFQRGESVAFMSFYGGNFFVLADLLEVLSHKKEITEIVLAKEVVRLLDSLTGGDLDYGNIEVKKSLLWEMYFKSVQPEISGDQVKVKIKDVAEDLRKKGRWIFQHIQANEKIVLKTDQGRNVWFNGYYDNQGRRVEGPKNNRVWMTLTGQVFPVMSGLANEEDIREIMASVQHFLRDEKLGGIRLNTDFGLRNYLDLGRAFGFAYGTKENGAFFSHMIVMYAYALYKRGYARQGYEVLRSIYNMCLDTERSRIYPGVPEYFDSEGRGRYHYLTGSASWWVLTHLTEVFGVRGQQGDLLLAPQLVREEFNEEGKAFVSCQFAGKSLTVTYVNANKLDYGAYRIRGVFLNEKKIEMPALLKNEVVIKREQIEGSPTGLSLSVTLER